MTIKKYLLVEKTGPETYKILDTSYSKESLKMKIDTYRKLYPNKGQLSIITKII